MLLRNKFYREWRTLGCTQLQLLILSALIVDLTANAIRSTPCSESRFCNLPQSSPSTPPIQSRACISSDNFTKFLKTLKQAAPDISNKDLWPPDYADVVMEQGVGAYDYIVVGAGTAGSVVASRLSEDSNVKVLVIEAGDDPPLESEMYTLTPSLHQNSKYSKANYAEPNENCCQAMVNGTCRWLRGEMIGGTGGLNGNFFVRGNKNDFDRWHQFGCTGWSWHEIKNIYEDAQHHTGEAAIGSLVVKYFPKVPAYDEFKALVLNASQELSIPQLPNLQAGSMLGYTANIQGTIEHGIRMSTGKTYLGKVARKPNSNLHVIKNAHVTKLLFNNERNVTHVKFQLGGRIFKAKVTKEVILSAGTFNSPKLLMLSGIGPKSDLQRLGIPIVADLPVGRNFHDHGMMPLLLKFSKPIFNAKMCAVFNNESIFNYLMFKNGSLVDTFSIMGFINTEHRYSAATTKEIFPNLHLTSHTLQANGDAKSFYYLGFKPEIIEAFKAMVGDADVMQIMGAVLRPKSRGRVRLRSANPFDNVRIENNFGQETYDRTVLLSFVRFVQALQRTTAFREYDLKLVHIPVSECNSYKFDTDDYWLCYIRYFYISSWHAVGTCRMGALNDIRSVVDPRLRVKGVRGLRVADASIMPEITSGNTNAPTILIGEKAAQMIRQDWTIDTENNIY